MACLGPRSELSTGITVFGGPVAGPCSAALGACAGSRKRGHAGAEPSSSADDAKRASKKVCAFGRFRGYDDLQKIGQGSFGTVFKARCIQSDELVALKRVGVGADEDGVSSSSLREVSLLRDLRHENIICMTRVIAEGNHLYMVFEYVEEDLRSLMQKGTLPPAQVRSFTGQIAAGLSYCHGRRVIHRDLKPQNILVGQGGEIKIADFGLSRTYVLPTRAYTSKVITLWYRAPEILLKEDVANATCVYSTAVDIWSLGCILAEMSRGTALFQADSEIDLLFRIFRSLGTPTNDTWPGVTRMPNYQASFPRWPAQDMSRMVSALSAQGRALLSAMLTYDPSTRATAKEIMCHPYFDETGDGAATVDAA